MPEAPALMIELREMADGRVVVAPVGALDLFSAPALDLELSRVLGSDKDVLVELERVTMIDSTGLRTLFSAWRTAHDAGLRLALTRGSSAVRAAVAGGALDRVLPWEAETATAD
jgi:anti-anti-sigma factor